MSSIISKDGGFYSLGRRFESIEDLMDYGRQCQDMPFDVEYFERFINDRLYEAKINKESNPQITNRKIFQILRMHTDWAQDKQEAERHKKLEDEQ